MNLHFAEASLSCNRTVAVFNVSSVLKFEVL